MGPDAPPAVTVHSESWGGRRRPLTDCKGHRRHIETGDETGWYHQGRLYDQAHASRLAYTLGQAAPLGKFIFRSGDTYALATCFVLRIGLDNLREKMSSYIVACTSDDGVRLAMYEGPSVALLLWRILTVTPFGCQSEKTTVGGSGVSLVQRRSTPLCQFNRGLIKKRR
jgi:hypothetical protein